MYVDRVIVLNMKVERVFSESVFINEVDELLMKYGLDYHRVT